MLTIRAIRETRQIEDQNLPSSSHVGGGTGNSNDAPGGAVEGGGTGTPGLPGPNF
jgi:hypothetical protein